MTQDTEERVKVGISIGDVNGIGMEIILKTFLEPAMLQVCTPVIYGSSKVLSYHRKALNINEFNYSTIRNLGEINQKKINLINCWEEDVKIDLGQPSSAGGKYAYKSLDAACKDLTEKKIDVLVTAPIDKKSIQQEGFSFPGHTEFLARMYHVKEYLMMMVNDSLRVSFVTGHVPLKNVSGEITAEKISGKVKLMHSTLQRDFGIRKPKIAVLALNPHSGDGGLIGKEEEEIIKPAVKKLFEEKMLVYGPYPADGFFGSGTYKNFDGIIAMYHDQGLIPFKALSFNSGINYTAGLPVIRTSPDHGTGYDIAGKNVASESSFREAIYYACDIFNRRNEFDTMTANPLAFSKMVGDR